MELARVELRSCLDGSVQLEDTVGRLQELPTHGGWIGLHGQSGEHSVVKTSEIILDTPALGSTAEEEDRELYLLLGGFAFFQATVAAYRFDVFGYLTKNPRAQVDAIAAGIGISRQSARVLLLACCALRLLRRDEAGGYSIAPLAQRAFVDARPGSLLPVLEAFATLHYPAMAFTTEALKQGTNAGLASLPGAGSTLYERLAENPELERVFHDWMRYLDGVGHSWLSAPELQKAKRVVDVGGGTGANALLLKQLLGNLDVIIFDLPSVCSTVEQKMKRWGGAARGIHTHAGNFLTDPFPAGADVFLFTRILNIYSPEVNIKLLKKCWDALSAEGHVIVASLLANDDESGPLSAAHLSLYFHVLATGEGMVYTQSDYQAWFDAAGFDFLRVYSVGRDRVLVAQK